MPCFSLPQLSRAPKEGSGPKLKPPATTIRGLKLDGEDAAEAAHRSTRKRNRPMKTASDQSESSEMRLLRFGPTYGDDIEVNKNAKVQALEHVFGQGESNIDYLTSIQQIEMQAKQAYHHSVNLRQTTDFEQRMVTDGCFFLQLALHILGGRELLGSHNKHSHFGDGKTDQWIPAMFHVGNQIPYVVIRALAERTYFRNAIKKGIETGIWQRPPKELPKLVLYLAVVRPQLHRNSNLFSSIFRKLELPRPRPPLPEETSDILHALHSLVLGPGNGPVHSEIKEFRDLEAGRDNDDNIRFPSAEELMKSNIRLKRAKNGITNIHFQDLIFCACLYVPPITIDSHTEHMFESLTSYEQNLNESDREVTAYLRFVRDLVQTYKDFEILRRKGIIQVEKEELKYSMVQMLNKVVTSHKSNYTLNFRQIKSDITDYKGPPWRLISFLLGLLTVVQTVFTVLSYFWPPA